MELPRYLRKGKREKKPKRHISQNQYLKLSLMQEANLFTD